MTQITKIETLDHSLDYGGVDVIINDTRKRYSGLVRGEVKASFGSCTGYALYCKEDPEESIQRATKFGHKQVWINLKAGVLTNSPEYYEREAAHWAKAPILNLGDLVEYEGNVYEIVPEPNDNFGLKLMK